MDWIRTINDAITYMEDHLTDEITLKDIAQSVNLSVFHFSQALLLPGKGVSFSDTLKETFL